jgi:putative nucleotidyltransferase with HDIG domain
MGRCYDDGFIPITYNKVSYLKDTDVFIRTKKGKYVKYGKTKQAARRIVSIDRFYNEFDNLYIKSYDEQQMEIEVRKNWSKKLKDNIRNNDPIAVKNQLGDFAEEKLFHDPRSLSDEMVKTYKFTIQSLIDSLNLEMLNMLVRVADKCNTTAQHSINCMTIGMALTCYLGWDKSDVFTFSLCCLLHDIGKLEIPDEILKAPRKLTESEFKIMKSHTKIGASILGGYNLGSENVNQAVRDCARYHHEKLDGTGYWGLEKTHISKFNKVLGIIDCYEALTSDNRPYRKSVDTLSALRVIKSDVINGKYDKRWFEQFVTNFAV